MGILESALGGRLHYDTITVAIALTTVTTEEANVLYIYNNK